MMARSKDTKTADLLRTSFQLANFLGWWVKKGANRPWEKAAEEDTEREKIPVSSRSRQKCKEYSE